MARPAMERPYRHPAVRLLDRLGPRSPCLVRYAELSEQSLLSGARNRSRLDDLGDESLLEPLRVLLRAYREETNLSFFGRLTVRERCLLSLQHHLEITELSDRHPDIAARAVAGPTFITGLPRTGTTLLYRLLAQDPGYRAPRLWEMLWPVPRAAHRGRDRRALAGRALAAGMQRLAPGLRVVHPLAGNLPEEDLPLLMASFSSLAFTLDAELPGYVRWLAEEGPAAGLRTYRWHRRVLQVLDQPRAPRRWLLKSPAHFQELQSLLAVYPDARLIVTHRDPLQVVPSACSLFAVTRGLSSPTVDLQRLGSWVLDLVAGVLRRAEAARATIPAAQLCDVDYPELLRSPLAVVRRIYRHFGDTLKPAAEERMAAWLEADRARRRPPHHYSAARFGLDEELIRRRLAPEGRRAASAG